MRNTYGSINGAHNARMREIAYRIFENDRNVVLYDVWDLLETGFEEMRMGDVHPHYLQDKW